MTTAQLLVPMTTSIPLATYSVNTTTYIFCDKPTMNGEESEREKSPPHGFNVSHEEEAPPNEQQPQPMMDLSILADAASKSPVRDVTNDNSLQASGAIPLPSVDNGNEEKEENKTASAAAKRPAPEDDDDDVDVDKKLASKRPRKLPSPKNKSPIQPKKRPARARKLPTKLKQSATPPSSMTSASSAMSAAAILVQVSGGSEQKKKSKPRKKAAPSAGGGGGMDLSGSEIRGITMKRPGKWVRFTFLHKFRHCLHIYYTNTFLLLSLSLLLLQQAQFYYAGQSRYIGIFTSQEKAAQAYEIVRKMLKSDAKPPSTCPREAFEISRRAAYDGVGETFPDTPKKAPPVATTTTASAKKKRATPKQNGGKDAAPK